MGAPIPNITGGAATATSGPASGRLEGAFSAPVVIGGFKSDGSAGATLPQGFLWIAGGVIAVIALYFWFRK